MPYRSIILFKKLALLTTYLLFACSCENDMKEIKALTEKKATVETIINVESYYSQQAKMKARLRSPLMKHYQVDSPYWEFPKSLHVDFYNDSLSIENQVNARYGRFKENQHLVFLKDSVVMFNLQGDTLFCRELWWDQQKQIFYTDKPVRIHQPDKIIHGIGLEAAQNFSWFKTKKANGPIQVPRNFAEGMGNP